MAFTFLLWLLEQVKHFGAGAVFCGLAQGLSCTRVSIQKSSPVELWLVGLLYTLVDVAGDTLVLL